MVRATNIFSVFLLIIIFGGSVCAQYNCDWKQVKQKHIKSASGIEVDSDGFRTLTRYEYDEEGRVIAAFWEPVYSKYHRTFDEQGNITRNVEIHAIETGGPEHHRFDTSFFEIMKYDQSNIKYYHLKIDFDMDGIRLSMSEQQGDTTRYYKIVNRKLLLQHFEVREKLKSGNRTYCVCDYDIWYKDKSNDIANSDTSYGGSCIITKYDRHNNETRIYTVGLNVYTAECYNGVRNGRLYNPILEEGNFVELHTKVINKYRLNGELRERIWIGVKYNAKPIVWTIPPNKGVASLDHIIDSGNVKFEYY